MKKIIKPIFVAVSFVLILTIMACNTSITDSQKEFESQEKSATDGETGSASFSLVIPDYYAMAGLESHARAIAPQTTRIKLSYKKSNTWIALSTVALSETEKTEIPNAPEEFVGSAYKCTFVNIPSGNYVAEAMKIDLLDSDDNVISSGTNSDVVSIMADKVSYTTFYTIPTSSNANSGSLSAGEMKFLKHEFDSRYFSAVSISVEDGNAYPDLVIFNENGTFCKYIQVSADNNYIDCAEYRSEYGDTTKYLGFWSANATSYSVSVGFNYETAFDNICTSNKFRDWNISCSNPEYLSNQTKGFRINGEEYKASIPRKVYLDKPKSLSFRVETNLYEKYDGSLQFLIDDMLVASYTGKNSVWENEVFELEAGEHRIEWRRDDPTTSYTTGIGTLFASVTNCAFGEPIQALSSINQDFESNLDTSMWIGSGLSASVISNGDSHGKVYKLGVVYNGSAGNSSLKIYKITLAQGKTLSFAYSCDLVNGDYNDYFRIYIDDSETPVFEAIGPKEWKTGTVTIPAGTHSVRFSAEKTYKDDGGYSYNYGANAVLLDNITLAL